MQPPAAGINHADERLRLGEFKQIFPHTLPMVVGSELSGEVVAVGSEVTAFTPGMKVYAYPDQSRMGAFAETVAVHQDFLAPAPSNITLQQAAGLPVVGLTAWQGLVKMGELRAGQTVLIHGGSGGVGTVAIQLAKHLGATVATTVSARNADFVRELGADIVIDYQNEDFTEILSDVDLVMDTQGGDVLKRSFKVVRPGGKVIGISGPPDPDFADRVGVHAAVKLFIHGASRPIRKLASRREASYHFLFIQPSGADLREIAKLVDDGSLKPIIDRTFPFAQTAQAFESLLEQSPRGKVIVALG